MRKIISQFPVYRIYLASSSLLVLFSIQRPLVNSQWDTAMALAAGLADIAIVAGMMAVYKMSMHYFKIGLWRSLSAGFHLFLGSLLIILAVFSQMLFLKTGEILDLALIRFGFREAKAVWSVAAGEISLEVFQPLLLALAFLLLMAAMGSQRSLIRYLAYTSFSLPFIFLPVSHAHEQLLQQKADAPSVVRENDSLYQGAYGNLSNKQIAWNSSGQQGWSMGILSGMTVGNVLGRLEYLALKETAGVEEVYRIDKINIGTQAKRPNVLMIILESVRYDVLGVYGLQPSVTPFLDAYAHQSLIVERAYTTIPHTSKALVGIYCGTFPSFTSRIHESLPGGLDGIECLPSLLGEAGYVSAHFQTATAAFEDREQLLLNMKFDHFTTQESFADEGWEQFGYLGLDDRAMLKPAVDWMKKQHQNDTPFFASLLTILTHHPYSSPGNSQPISSTAQAFQAYLSALEYTDVWLEELFVQLEEQGLLDDTLVIITGDHGEGFAEHGQIAHNGTAYEEGMRVPLFIRSPEKTFVPGIIGGIRQHIDIFPTILESAGIELTGLLPGVNLLSENSGHKEIITSCFYDDYCLTHINNSGEKLIYFYGGRNIELYDVVSDPTERNNFYNFKSGMNDIVQEKLFSAIRMRNNFEAVYE